MDRYKQRGVSAKKEDVHNALEDKIDKGIFPDAFCKIVEDHIGGDKDYCNIMHADGAGTKSSLAYLYYKETGDISIFKGIVMDSVAMNIDDLLCVGATDNFLLSNTIGRNPKFIDGQIIKILIHEFQRIAQWYNDMGISMVLTGGETADVGDLVRTLIVDSTVVARLKKDRVIANDRIKPGMVIIGFASYGKSNYETEYNSGIGSNGLTSARHDVFMKDYADKYPETYNPDIDRSLIYSGKYKVTDMHPDLPYNIGKAVLSPTRTYAPLVKTILKELKDNIGGMIHCTGGGQTKCLRFGRGVHYYKNDMMDIPPIFKIIKEESGTEYRQMYQVFNMGHRLEIITENKYASLIMDISKDFNIQSKIIGEVKDSKDGKNHLTIKSPNEEIEYNI
jgi:phosphoribosylformylglycinamidine cyclo-ligase